MTVKKGKQPEILDVRRIWDEAPHNAFTDLIRHKNEWFCTFREAQTHASSDGALRVIRSKDGESWESAALIKSDSGHDLRDPKLSITPDNKLMLSGAESCMPRGIGIVQSMVWFSEDGTHWSEEHKIGDPNFWLWRIVWHKGTAYSAGYGRGTEERRLRLYKSLDGKKFQIHVDNLLEFYRPSEPSLLFSEDNTAWCLLRREGEDLSALLGTAIPPYTEWEWKDLGIQKNLPRVGGPNMIRIPDGRLIAAVRLYDDPKRTALCRVDPDSATLTELLTLPSGGDTSYAGLVWHDDMLWVSYYSSHEGKTAIYLARVGF